MTIEDAKSGVGLAEQVTTWLLENRAEMNVGELNRSMRRIFGNDVIDRVGKGVLLFDRNEFAEAKRRLRKILDEDETLRNGLVMNVALVLHDRASLDWDACQPLARDLMGLVLE